MRNFDELFANPAIKNLFNGEQTWLNEYADNQLVKKIKEEPELKSLSLYFLDKEGNEQLSKFNPLDDLLLLEAIIETEDILGNFKQEKYDGLLDKGLLGKWSFDFQSLRSTLNFYKIKTEKLVVDFQNIILFMESYLTRRSFEDNENKIENISKGLYLEKGDEFDELQNRLNLIEENLKSNLSEKIDKMKEDKFCDREDILIEKSKFDLELKDSIEKEKKNFKNIKNSEKEYNLQKLALLKNKMSKSMSSTIANTDNILLELKRKLGMIKLVNSYFLNREDEVNSINITINSQLKFFNV